MLIPLLIMGGIIGVMGWASRKNKSDTRAPLGDMGHALTPELVAQGVPRLAPEHERLLCLLCLFQKDKRFPRGRKRYLNYPLAKETVSLCRKFGLHQTVEAIALDMEIPGEPFPGRAMTVREAVAMYNRNGSI